VSVLEITGVVTPLGPAGYGEDKGLWTLGVSLRPWRDAAGTLFEKEIFLLKAGLKLPDLDQLRAGLPELGLVRLRLSDTPHWREYEAGTKRWEGKLVAVVDNTVSDEVLAAWVDKQRRPVIVHDSFFGALQLDRRLNAYDGRRSAGTGSYELSLERATEEDDDSGQDRELIERSRSSFEQLERELPRYMGAAADELLALYNDTWRNEDEHAVLDLEEFMASLTLQSARRDARGHLYIYLSPGDLFAGHWIELRTKASGEVTSIGLSG